MDDATFWSLIERTRPRRALRELLMTASWAAHSRRQRHEEALRAALRRRPPEEIAAFDALLRTRMNEAYRWDIWGAAYIINGGCGDDSFEYFRLWLIGRGRADFEAAQRDPEALAGMPDVREDETNFEELLYVPAEAYEEATGSELPKSIETLRSPAEPAGPRWAEDELPARLPRLWARFGGA